MITLVAATGNANKLKELREILADTPFDVVSMKDAGFTGEIEETGSTFAENARIKAAAVCRATGLTAVADDSGLVVEAMGGEPGIYSARFISETAPQSEKNAEILRRLKDTPEEARGARFVCAMCCIFPDGREFTSEGIFEGRIGRDERGANGFGYDPIFYLPEYGCTSAELPPEEKNRISHRGKAMRELAEKLRGSFSETAAGESGRGAAG